MKIAVPTISKKGFEDLIGQHFGRSPTYTIVDSESSAVKVVNNTSHHMGGSGYPPELLSKKGVKAILCSGMGSRALQMFKDAGIKVYVGAFGTVADAIESWRNGELQEADETHACTQHAFRGPLHGTGLCKKK